MDEQIQQRIEQLRRTIEAIDKIFLDREYSGKEVRDFLRCTQKLIESGEMRLGSEGEVTHFPESMPLIVEMILAYTRAVRKIELINLESGLNKAQEKMVGESL